MKCHHEIYVTQEAAEAAMCRAIENFKRTGKGGKSWKRFNVFPCGNHWHYGRANKLPANYVKPAPPTKQKPHSWGWLQHRLERIGKQIDHGHRKRLTEISRLVEEDAAIAKAEADNLAAIHKTIQQFLKPANQKR